METRICTFEACRKEFPVDPSRPTQKFCCPAHRHAYHNRTPRRYSHLVPRSQFTLEDDTVFQLEEERKRARVGRYHKKNTWLLRHSRIAFFDIEASNLSPIFGEMLCACVKWNDHEDIVTLVGGRTGDKKAAQSLRRELEQADFVVGYYSRRFDLPYLNTRLYTHKLAPVGLIRHIDLYPYVRGHLKLTRNRLENVEVLLEGKTEKTHIEPTIWLQALRGNPKAVAYVVDHCQRDVLILERVFNQLVGFINLDTIIWRHYGKGYGR